MDTDPAKSRGQREACGGTNAQPGDVDTPGSGDKADDGNDGSCKDGKQ